MELFGGYLKTDQYDQQGQEYDAASQIAQIHRHCDGIAAGLTQRGRQNFDDPESQRDGWYLACY
jgi:hypothetical protein